MYDRQPIAVRENYVCNMCIISHDAFGLGAEQPLVLYEMRVCVHTCASFWQHNEEDIAAGRGKG